MSADKQQHALNTSILIPDLAVLIHKPGLRDRHISCLLTDCWLWEDIKIPSKGHTAANLGEIMKLSQIYIILTATFISWY
jgi:hypothetical protein